MFYFEDGPGRPSAAKLLSKDEARRVAQSVGLKEQLIGLNYQTTADRLGLFSVGVFITLKPKECPKKTSPLLRV
jgi:hypothetical protein